MHPIPTEEQVNVEYGECMDHLKGNNTNCYWAISWFIGNNIKNTEELKIPILDRISNNNKISLVLCLSIIILSCAMLIIFSGIFLGLFTSEELTTFVGWLIGGSSGGLLGAGVLKLLMKK
jgi:hypothetical protein